MITKAKNAADVLMLHPVVASGEVGALQRKVTKSWQLSLPVALLNSVGLDCSDWVYISVGSDGASLRVTPAQRVGRVDSTPARAGSRVNHR